MEPSSENAPQELALFRKFLNLNRKISSWIYYENGDLLSTDNTDLTAHRLFQHTGCLDYAVAHFRVETVPVMLGSQLGLFWGAVREQAQTGSRIHVIGPCLSSEVSPNVMKEFVNSVVEDMALRKDFEALFQSLSVVPLVMFQEYLLMLNCCIRGEELSVSDIHLQNGDVPPPGTDHPKNDRYQIYMAEKALLYYVREGNLNYKESFSRAGVLSNGIRVTTRNPVDQARISVSGFITLCTRAAIEGGLSPDTAYSVGDSYIQSLMGCKSVTEVGAISTMMYEDFVQRVRKEKKNAHLSITVRDCAEYIQNHPDEDLSLEKLANRFGYTDYYLSHKFKKEMGESLNSYMNRIRVERAMLLLETTDQSISDIALNLHFCSSSYFSDTFKGVTGQSPLYYRREKQKR